MYELLYESRKVAKPRHRLPYCLRDGLLARALGAVVLCRVARQMPRLARYVCRLPNVTVLCCSIGARVEGGACYRPTLDRLRYDDVSRFIVDGSSLAHALFGKQNVDYNARLGERPNLVGVLNHHVVERERFAIGELGSNLFGKLLVLERRFRRCFGLGSVLLEHVELMGNLAGKVLGRVLLGVIVVPKRGLDDLGRDFARHVHQSGEHLVVGELKLGASGSHELTPICPRDASEPPFGSFFSVPFGQLLLYYCIDFLARTILKNMKESWKPQVDGLVFSDSQNIGTVAK